MHTILKLWMHLHEVLPVEEIAHCVSTISSSGLPNVVLKTFPDKEEVRARFLHPAHLHHSAYSSRKFGLLSVRHIWNRSVKRELTHVFSRFQILEF